MSRSIRVGATAAFCVAAMAVGSVGLAGTASAATSCGTYQRALIAASTMNSVFLDQGDTQNANYWGDVYDGLQAAADAAGCY